MISDGGTRPPLPITVGAGRAFPCDSTVTVGEDSSVVVRFVLAAPPGLNSVTRPFTLTESPTATDGADDVNANSPSEVASLESGAGSWK